MKVNRHKSPIILSIYQYVQDNARSVNFDFEIRTNAYAGCSAVLNGALLLFGGNPEQNQVSIIHLLFIGNLKHAFKVSEVSGCSLKRIGILPFDFYYGSCNTFAFPNEKVLLCFDLNHSQSCHT